MCSCDTSKIYPPPWGIHPSEAEIVARMSDPNSPIYVNYHHEVGCVVRYGASDQTNDGE